LRRRGAMKLPPKITIIENFKDLKDPRVERTKRHKLIDIVVITICAVICGADGWAGIETYGKAKQQWLKQFLELPNGIPSHDTFSRVFARIDPIELQSCFLKWINSIKNIKKGEVIAIDGKTLKHSYDKGGEKGAIHMVSAWATANRLVLGQRKVEEKSNEITAIPELIKVLDIAGCLVTIDAMGCQREIVKLITEKQGDYIITLKKNQKTLYKNVEELFQKAIATGCEGINKSEYHTREENHGREEIRHYLMLSDIGEIIDPEGKWKNIKSVGINTSDKIRRQ
jgi:predicted transposase YbfD/YdcC